MALTQEEIEQIEEALRESSKRERKTAKESKRDFFEWLRNTGLGHLVGKLIDYAWHLIKVIIDWL